MKNALAFASALALAGYADAVPAASSTTCCRELSQALPSVFFSPSTSQYNTLINARWSGTSVLHPGCVVTPKSALDVSKAVKIIVKNQCQFAVRGGGHNANPGFNSIDDGVSIDLSSLNSASLAKDRSYIGIGAGITWGETYDAFNSSNIGFTGGICEDVSAGGISLGGGQSLFQPKRGWAIDNILNYEIVLASGEIVNANATSYPDLFKALKGGNTNFGIASYSEVQDQMSQALVDFTANNHFDVNTSVQLMTVYLANNQGQIVNAAFGNTIGEENPASLQEFLNMPNQVKHDVGHIKLADFVHQVSEFQAKGYRQVTSSITFSNDYVTVRDIWDVTDEIYNGLEHKDQVDWMISFIPQPMVQQSYAARSGGNSLGLQSVTDDQIVVWLTSRWTDPSLDSMMYAARDDFITATEAVAKKYGTYHPFLYINYASPSQNPLCGYGVDNFNFLKTTAAKYDPHGVFQKLMPGGFKVSKTTCS
ncbi:FAD binding domain-containing protein [Trichoderma breve]|uniref:FAD binding domain-containing protein n=1 Tax=Trichoderma breve TaxID=2034170 RepID=A0A9W9BDW6_9HYPO|nr:FAD binding domain-containing protein [Trichoderma breve]KAJ4858133.1 FAD binding domain-containing protein [Trichoderma breve]